MVDLLLSKGAHINAQDKKEVWAFIQLCYSSLLCGRSSAYKHRRGGGIFFGHEKHCSSPHACTGWSRDAASGMWRW